MLLGLDVGGTHTDVVIIDKTGIVATDKVKTNHNDLLETVNRGIENAVKNVNRDDIERVNLSTTLSTNAIVEGKTENVAVLVSAGPGVDPANYRLGEYYYSITGSIDHRGTEILPLNTKETDSALKAAKKAGCKVYAAITKFSTRNPAQENRLCEKIGSAADFITAGHMLSGRLSFPRRVATAYYNSAVWRQFNAFAESVEKSINGFGIKANLNILKADGGTMPLAVSKGLPVESILSGPAASVMGIIALCRVTRDSVLLDIGGTTTDIAIFASGAPIIEPDGISLNSAATLVRALRTKSIGIGGDSVLRVRDGGVVSVGPDRLGPSLADGGAAVALTDAFNFMKIDSHGDVNASAAGIAGLAKNNGMKPNDLAKKAIDCAVGAICDAVRRLVDEINMKPVYTIHELLEGKKVAPEQVYVMGGPAKAFSKRLADALRLPVNVPQNYAVANAIGAALARTTMYIELLADTEKGRMIIPDIGVSRDIPAGYSLEEAEADAKKYLLGHMKKTDVADRHIHAEILDSASFNMVQGYDTTGRNIRVRCQVKPGVLHEYNDVLRNLC